MHTGMLWFDNSKTDLEVKIKKAIEYYQKKHGRMPDLVFVHPSMLHGDGRITASFTIDKITVRPYRPVLPGHIWIGIEDKQ
jgi:hypothetical protein